MLIALYERAVGFYASLVGINAYHQPGVEAGKKAATKVLELQRRLSDILGAAPGETADALAAAADADPEETYHVLRHLAANGGAIASAGTSPAETRFSRAG
jgi:glucose-6-phosphate isomerase